MGFSDYRLYAKWQREIKKKRKKTRMEKKAAGNKETDDEDKPQIDAGNGADKKRVGKSAPKESGLNDAVAQDVVHNVEDRVAIEAAASALTVPSAAATVVASTDDNEKFLLPDRPVSTPRRRENAGLSDSEDYGDISDSELDFSFR
jgi:hypothetical protein